MEGVVSGCVGKATQKSGEGGLETVKTESLEVC